MAASTVRSWSVGTIGREMSEDVILDWAVNVQCGRNRITLYPVGCENPVPKSFMHG